MTTPGLFLIRDNIFGHLSYEDLEICCEVSDSWNESLNKKSSLKRLSLVKYLLQFGERHFMIYIPNEYKHMKVDEVIPGWDKAVKKVGSEASLDDLKEIKESLQKYDHASSNACCHRNHRHLVFWAAEHGDLKLMKLIFETSYDMNTQEEANGNAFFAACEHSNSTEMVQLMIRSSKDHGIDLNMQNWLGRSAFHVACQVASLEIPKLLLENYKEFGIDIMMHEDTGGYTALDMLKSRLDDKWEIEEGVEEWEKFKSILEEEYAKHDSLEPAA